MLKKLRNTDTFAKNVIVVFIASSLSNFLNLLFQLFIAHKLTASDFAAVNSLISLFMLIYAPLDTLRLTVIKHISEFRASGSLSKIRFLLSSLTRWIFFFASALLVILLLNSAQMMEKLKISSASLPYIFSLWIFLWFLIPIFSGGVQGMELFGWLSSYLVISTIAKFFFAVIFIFMGYSICGALGALLASSLIGLAILYYPLKDFITFRSLKKEDVDFKQIFTYLLPTALGTFCFMALVNMDMVLVKYFYSAYDSGMYSLGQMVGKIFLFLPLAVTVVMFPKTSGLKAKQADTSVTFKRSL
ncbi:MAG: oligosaccharide flippase family protein, partial [Candidatus Omnitrophica bacterium]|nr:oligosaccharide flippase family protein [Candidatus Omnitrophota bacterium]